MSIDVASAARTYLRRREAHEAYLRTRLQEMRKSAGALIAHVRDAYDPARIYQWGSLLNAHNFSDISDIDIAVEGILDLRTWLRLEKELVEMTPYPLDLVRWENLWPEHKRAILRRGAVVYDREKENQTDA